MARNMVKRSHWRLRLHRVSRELSAYGIIVCLLDFVHKIVIDIQKLAD
jgi:hypothetical protein